jgi:hypothetical protein
MPKKVTGIKNGFCNEGVINNVEEMRRVAADELIDNANRLKTIIKYLCDNDQPMTKKLAKHVTDLSTQVSDLNFMIEDLADYLDDLDDPRNRRSIRKW